MKKGFTLIELLAVIVILAIIALIAVPIILNIINSTEEESQERSKELYLSAVKNAIAKKNLNEPNKEFNPTVCKVNKDGNLSCTFGEEEIDLKVEVEGLKPCTGTIIIDNGKIESETVSFDCYYIDNSGANVPDLMDTLTPVKYNYESKKWVVADPASEWYNYSKEEWANAVIFKDNVKKEIGETINVPNTKEEIASSDILAMFVWIPRYSYTIKSPYGVQLEGEIPSQKTPGAIDIKFVGTNVKDKGSASYSDEIGASWYTHPAFTFGSVELSGIWVGKFETTGTAEEPTILPNQISLRNREVSEQLEIARKFNENLKNNGDSHMMKNSEWGATAYLSQSIYGKYNNKNYTNSNKEVYKNDSNSHYTGRSSGKPSTNDSSSEGTCKYDDEGTNRASGTGLCGPGASTTGNVYGIYDMSGGAWETVMGNFSDTVGSSGFEESFFTDPNNAKYYDKYSSNDNANSCDGNECKGHALNETKGWYDDRVLFISSSDPWFDRGGHWNGVDNTGVFAFDDNIGISGYCSFRVVIS